jgi:hypothetical protein
MDGPYESNLVAIEIKKPEHLAVYERVQELGDKLESDGGDAYYIGRLELWERSKYMTCFGGNWVGYTTNIEATDRWVEEFLINTEEMDDPGDIENLVRGW